MLLWTLISSKDYGILIAVRGLDLGPVTVIQLTDALTESSYTHLFGAISLGPLPPIDLIRLLHNGYVNTHYAYRLSCHHHDEERLKVLISLEVALRSVGHRAHLLFSACTDTYASSWFNRANELLWDAGLISAMSSDYLFSMSFEAWMYLLKRYAQQLPRQELSKWFIMMPPHVRNNPDLWKQLDLSQLPLPGFVQMGIEYVRSRVRDMSAYLNRMTEPVAFSQLLRHYLDSLQFPIESRESYHVVLRRYLYAITPRGAVTPFRTHIGKVMAMCLWGGLAARYKSSTVRPAPMSGESTIFNAVTPVTHSGFPQVSPTIIDETFIKAFTLEALNPTMCSLLMQFWLTQRPINVILQMVLSKRHICRGITNYSPEPREATSVSSPFVSATNAPNGQTMSASRWGTPSPHSSTSSEDPSADRMSFAPPLGHSCLENADLVTLAQRILTNGNASWSQMEALFAATTDRSFGNALLQGAPSDLLPHRLYLQRLAPLSWRISYYRSIFMMPAPWPLAGLWPRTYQLLSHLTSTNLAHRINELLAYPGAFRIPQLYSQQDSSLLLVRPCVWLASPILLELIESSLYALLKFGKQLFLWDSQYCLAIQGEIKLREKLEIQDLRLMCKTLQVEGTLKGHVLASDPLALEKAHGLHCKEWRDNMMWDAQTAIWQRIEQEWALQFLFMPGSLCEFLSLNHQDLY